MIVTKELFFNKDGQFEEIIVANKKFYRVIQ